MRKLRLYSTLILLLFGYSAIAQSVSSDEANSLFVKGKYLEAIPKYKTLLNRFPEDPTFNYRLGISLLLSNENVAESYKYLKISATKDVPNMVYFYLGEACRYLYKFDESLEYYKRFMTNGGSSEVPKVMLELAASAASNGQNLLKFGANVTPMAFAQVGKDDFYKAYDTYGADEGFGPIPESLLTSLDRRRGNKTLIFSRKDGGKPGDISVFASYGQGETNSLDLFFIEKQSDGSWSRPLRLPNTINSPFDENYPYMCPDNKTLYFASKGLYSVGGYDIYKVTYSKETNQWSTPENLGFPINSAYDDYLLIPGQNEDIACFTSSRSEKGEDYVGVFKISGVSNPLRIEITPQMALEMQKLNPKAKANTDKESDTKALNESQSKPAGVEQLIGYQRIKAQLANNDMLLDTTVSKIERLRTLWSTLPDTSRKDVERLIVMNEKRLSELNEMHNVLTDRAIEMEQSYLSGTLKSVPEEKPAVNVWFAHDPKVAIYLDKGMVEKLKQSPLEMGVAMSVVDSIASINVELSDLFQMSNATVGGEHDRVEHKIVELEDASRNLKQIAATKWGWFYASYFEVMDRMAQAISAVNQEADPSILNQAHLANLSAKGVRNNVELSDNSIDNYKRLEEAFLTERRALNLVNLYLAQAAGNNHLSDSLNLKLFPPSNVESIGDGAVQKQSFGELKRSDITFEEVKFSSAAGNNQFLIGESPSFSVNTPMPTIKAIPSGVIFAIQLGSFSQQLNYSLFKFNPMFYEVVGNIRKVYAGIFNTYSEAQSQLPQVKANGFKDAFIVAFLDRKAISTAQGRQMEVKSTTPAAVSTTSTSTLFRVVLGTFSGNLPANIKAIAEKYLGDKEIIKSALADGSNTYSIGNFNNFDEAIPLKDKLISEGVVEAFITKFDVNQIAE